MASKRAPPDLIVEGGIYIAGNPPFVHQWTDVGRLVANPSFDFTDNFFRKITHYLTLPLARAVAGPTVTGGGNNWVANYTNATRVRFPFLGATVYCVILVMLCDAEPTDQYRRVYLAPQPLVP